MKRIALLGMPNTGKSTFFNRISGASARVGNWPGITVDLMGAKILVGGHIAELVDLPGIYDFHGFSEDEMVVRHFLENNSVNLVFVILNTTQIERQLSLALQVRELGLPAVLILNMADEARRAGITVNLEKISLHLQMPAALISAKYGEGCQQIMTIAGRELDSHSPITSDDLQARLASDDRIEGEMVSILDDAVELPAQLPDGTTEKIDRVVLHPWLGLPLFFGVMFLLFQFIFTLGKPLQDGVAWLLGYTRGDLSSPCYPACRPGSTDCCWMASTTGSGRWLRSCPSSSCSSSS